MPHFEQAVSRVNATYWNIGVLPKHLRQVSRECLSSLVRAFSSAYYVAKKRSDILAHCIRYDIRRYLPGGNVKGDVDEASLRLIPASTLTDHSH